MADIDVVPKHRHYTWLWVLLAVIVIAAVILLFAGRPREAALLQDGQSIVASAVMPLGS
jgi:bacteriorhodopsin